LAKKQTTGKSCWWRQGKDWRAVQISTASSSQIRLELGNNLLKCFTTKNDFCYGDFW